MDSEKLDTYAANWIQYYGDVKTRAESMPLKEIAPASKIKYCLEILR
jgi:hypothetical protein